MQNARFSFRNIIDQYKKTQFPFAPQYSDEKIQIAINEGKNIISANVFSKDNTYKSNEIEINVKKNNLESKKVFRNIEDMRNLSVISNGNYYDVEDFKNIKPSIFNNIDTKKEKINFNIDSFDKFWFIVLITLIIEWFFRKKKGLL